MSALWSANVFTYSTDTVVRDVSEIGPRCIGPLIGFYRSTRGKNSNVVDARWLWPLQPLLLPLRRLLLPTFLSAIAETRLQTGCYN